MRIVILIFVIIISLIFKYYIFQLQYFKEPLLEYFDNNNNSMSDIKDPNVKNAILDFKRKKDVITYYEDIQKNSNGVNKIVLSSNDMKYSNAINTSISEINTSKDNVEKSNSLFQIDLNQINALIGVKNGNILSLKAQIDTLNRKYNEDLAKIDADNKITTELINNQGTNIYKKKENFGTIMEGAGACSIPPEITQLGGIQISSWMLSNCIPPPPPPPPPPPQPVSIANVVDIAPQPVSIAPQVSIANVVDVAQKPLNNLAVKGNIIIYYNFNEVYDSLFVKNLFTNNNDLNLQIYKNAKATLDNIINRKCLNCKGNDPPGYGGLAAVMSTRFPGGSGYTYNFGTKFTIMFWMLYEKFDITNTGIIWICNWDDPTTEPIRDICIRLEQNEKKINIVVAIGAFQYKHDANLTKDVWNHIAVTLDVSNLNSVFSTILTIYVNGMYTIHPLGLNRFLSNNIPAKLSEINTIFIGRSFSAGKNYGSFKGYIDDFIVYNTILTNDDIGKMYGGNVSQFVTLPGGYTKYLPLESNVGDATCVGKCEFTNVAGKYCIEFKNKSNYIFMNFDTNNSFTICYWIYVKDGGYYTAASVANNGDWKNKNNPVIQFEFGSRNGGFIHYNAELQNRGNKRTEIYSKYNAQNRWTHVAYTYNKPEKNSIQLYVNGNREVYDNENGGLAYRTHIILGRSGDDNRGFNGYMRQFVYYKSVLEQNGIIDVMKATEN